MANLSGKDILIRGSAIGAIATVPSITVFLVMWLILDDLIVSAIAGSSVHFIAMILSIKFAKRFLVKRDPEK